MKTTKLLKKRTMLKAAMLLSLGCFLMPAELKAQLVITTVTTDVSCNGGCDGSATATVIGGVPPYYYQWNTTPVQTTATATGLCSGVYTITVFDSDTIQNTAADSLFIFEPSALVLSLSSTNASCDTCTDGSASVTASGGILPYAYVWYKDSLLWDTTATINGLLLGFYCVTVTDALGCTSSGCVNIIADSSNCNVSVSVVSTDASCGACNDGSATVTATGTPPYTYTWNTTPVQTTQTATGLLPGTYCVTVTDSSGCNSTACITIANGQCSTFSSTITSTDASCPTCNDGSATVAATGGTPPYTYLWDSTTTTPTITGLLPGWYCVTVTDSLGCNSAACVAIANGQCNTFSSTITSTNASCPTCNDGSATVATAGGTAPYAYLWSDSTTAATNTGLLPGTYCVWVTDALGCTSTGCVAIDSTSVLPNCSVFIYDSAGVALYAIPTLGTAPFTYLWDDSLAQTTQSITPASPGLYCVTVTDNSGCTASACYQFNSGVCNAYFFPYIDSTQANLVYLIENSTGNNLTYLWDFGDGNTSTQQFPSHTYPNYGTYNICLTITSIDSCVDIFCMLVQLDSINKVYLGYSVIVIPDPFGTSTGINNEENNYTETKIYPNPSSSKVYIELTGWGASATITLFNVIGQDLSREVISLNPGKNTVELDLNDYHKGLYFIRIDSGKLRETKRISKIY